MFTAVAVATTASVAVYNTTLASSLVWAKNGVRIFQQKKKWKEKLPDNCLWIQMAVEWVSVCVL